MQVLDSACLDRLLELEEWLKENRTMTIEKILKLKKAGSVLVVLLPE